MHCVSELANVSPLALLEQLLPFMRLAMKRARKDEELPAEDGIWYLLRCDRTDVRSVDLLDIVRAALAEVASTDPQAVMRLLRELRPEAHIHRLHLLLETVATTAQGLRAILVEQLDKPSFFINGNANVRT